MPPFQYFLMIFYCVVLVLCNIVENIGVYCSVCSFFCEYRCSRLVDVIKFYIDCKLKKQNIFAFKIKKCFITFYYIFNIIGKISYECLTDLIDIIWRYVNRRNILNKFMYEKILT